MMKQTWKTLRADAPAPILFSTAGKTARSGMYLRQQAAQRIISDPGIETIPSLNEGSTMRGVSSGEIFPYHRKGG